MIKRTLALMISVWALLGLGLETVAQAQPFPSCYCQCQETKSSAQIKEYMSLICRAKGLVPE